MAGKPRGPKSDKLWSDAVRMAVLREDRDEDGKIRKRLNVLADNLVKLAMEGDMQAIKEVGDRLDGKPKQMIEGPGENGEHSVVSKVEWVVVQPSASGS